MPETRKTSAAKAKTVKPKVVTKTQRAKPGPKPKVPPKKPGRRTGGAIVNATPPPPQTEQDGIWAFIRQQADFNRTMLDELRGLKDKSGSVDSGVGGSNNMQSGAASRVNNRTQVVEPQVEVLSDTELSDESDIDIEGQVANDLIEVNALLQPRFANTTGKCQSRKKEIQYDIKTQRPFAFLDRGTQRGVLKENGHPEELPFILHVEGLLGMLHDRCKEDNLKGLAFHVLQVVRDVQVHSWSKICKWSNEVVLNTAMKSWQWADADRITQARNSQYLVPNSGIDLNNATPCYQYNKGECKFDNDHYGLDNLTIHACAFCYAIDGSVDRHPSRGCAKKRSSANYFKNREEGKDHRSDKKFKQKKLPYKDQAEEKSKN